MTPDALAAHIAKLPRYPCGCTVGHEHLCPVAQGLWDAVVNGWKDMGKGKIDRRAYFALCKKYLDHFEKSALQEILDEAEGDFDRDIIITAARGALKVDK